MSPRTYIPLPIGSRVMVARGANPNGPGVVVRSNEWTVTVKLDRDGIEYLFGNSAVSLVPAPFPANGDAQ